MDPKSSLDPVEEARARVRLAHRRGKAVRPPPKALGVAANRFVRSKTKGKTTSLQKLQNEWREIVGETFWKICRPEKLTKGKSGRSLVLRVVPAAAAMVQHEVETLRQRISVTAGGDVTEIQIIQGNLSDRGTGLPRRGRALTFQETAYLEQAVANIGPPGLRAAIVALGVAMLTAEPSAEGASRPSEEP
jgi:hypothetical protein